MKVEIDASLRATFHKCGEIATSLLTGNGDFYLICDFCDSIFMQLDTFASHINNEHLQNSNKLDIESTEDLDIRINSKGVVNRKRKSSVEIPVEIKSKYTKKVQDPLEDKISSAEEDAGETNNDVNEENVSLQTNNSSDNDASDREDMYMDNLPNTKHSNDPEFSHDGDSKDDEDSDTSGSNKVDGSDDMVEPDDKNITLTLIAEYELHRLLWDCNDPQVKNWKKRKDAYKEITNNINKAYDVNFKWQNVSKRIGEFRNQFRKDSLNQKRAESKGEIYQTCWYYDKLSFLHTSIKCKERKKRGAKPAKPALPLTDLTDAHNVELINIYRSYPCLWNVQDISYRFKNRRQEAMTSMQDAIKTKMGLTVSLDELQKKIYKIRYACTQEKNRKIQRECLGKSFQPRCKFYNEIAFLEDHVGPFKCSVCAELMNGVDRYRVHMSAHDGSMPFTCPYCNRGFMQVGNCTVHMRRHIGEYEFECKVCKKRYATSTDLRVHMRYHTGEKPYFCDICGQSYRTWTFFDTHIRRHQKRHLYKCSMCSKGFYENGRLNEHMKAHMNVRDKECNVCGKTFTSVKYLRQHEQIHAEKKKYVCKICGKDFAQYAGLSGHMRSHGTTLLNKSSGSAVGNTSNPFLDDAQTK